MIINIFLAYHEKDYVDTLKILDYEVLCPNYQQLIKINDKIFLNIGRYYRLFFDYMNVCDYYYLTNKKNKISKIEDKMIKENVYLVL